VSTWDFVQICFPLASLIWVFQNILLTALDLHPWIRFWVVYLESSFTNVGNDLHIYLPLMVTNCS